MNDTDRLACLPERTAEPIVLLETRLPASDLGQGPDGELYVADIVGGTTYPIVAAEAN